MPLNSPRDLVVVRKEEKEAKLGAFLTSCLAGGACPQVTVVARSVRSPVVAVLARTVPAVGQAPAVRLVLALAEAAPEIERLAKAGWSIRVLEDRRFLDAHEQLVARPDTIWIGDCMRREPETRDAFERYATHRPMTAAGLERTFGELWRRARPFATPARAIDRAARVAAAALGEAAESTEVATRQ